MTYAEVEAMINARLNHPPQSMLVSAGPRNTPHQAPVYARDERQSDEPARDRLAYEAREPLDGDISTTVEQLALPPNAKCEYLIRRARMFDRPPSRGGWRPRPPPDAPRSCRTGAVAVVGTSKRGPNVPVACAPR